MITLSRPGAAGQTLGMQRHYSKLQVFSTVQALKCDVNQASCLVLLCDLRYVMFAESSRIILMFTL